MMKYKKSDKKKYQRELDKELDYDFWGKDNATLYDPWFYSDGYRNWR